MVRQAVDLENENPGMKPIPLELQRARKQLEAFCRQRNRSGMVGSEWCLSQHGSEFLISEYGARHKAAPVLRLRFDDGRWFLSVPLAGDRWQAYAPRPEACSIDAVIKELEQAPLHVHWG